MNRKILAFVLALGAAAWPFPARAEEKAEEAPPSVSAKAAVVVNADDGTVLYAKNEKMHLAIASTTKIMTALLTLEAARNENRAVTIRPEMIRVEGSTMGLRSGDRLTLKDLAAGMLTVSGNDAANAAAFAVSGTLKMFAVRMNERAASLGMKDTHFVTPSGLDDAGHYSCAYDMALLACAAMKNTDFARITGETELKIRFLNPEGTRTFENHNKLLRMYSGCTGVKTGYTRKAGRCLVSSAEKDGVRVIAVTLNDPDDWAEHKTLLDYGFSRLVSRSFDDTDCRISLPAVGGAKDSVMISGTDGGSLVLRKEEAETLTRTVELPRFLYAPISAGQVLGKTCYRSGGKTVMETELVSAEEIPKVERRKSWFERFWEGILRLFS